MFYSQFILAKKGPLGTIWIAAHLERKLRKNQVAETNIGVSVDSILFPEVPIALRLSGHLLLGVVRIYSKKVNYLFHDCSEALVKIKQAFHSTIVDLPPEAATAPFHSITLPETFDFDELELLQDPERSFVQCNGNFVDHNVTTREQITLQDPMEDIVYPGSSQFGLDERFVDGDSSPIGLDFDEDIFTEKLGSPVVRPSSPVVKEDTPSTSRHGDEADLSNRHEPSTPVFDMDRTERHEPKEPSGLEQIRADQQQNVSLLSPPLHCLGDSDMARSSCKDPDVFLSGDAMPSCNAILPQAQQLFEARTPDLNKEFCPPDEPSTPALPEETALLFEQETSLFSGPQERLLSSCSGGVERARFDEHTYTSTNQVSVVSPLVESRENGVVPAQSILQHFPPTCDSNQSHAATDLQQVSMTPQQLFSNSLSTNNVTLLSPDQSFRLNPIQQPQPPSEVNINPFQGFYQPASVQQLPSGLFCQSGGDLAASAPFSSPLITQHFCPSACSEQSSAAMHSQQVSMPSEAQLSSMLTSQNASSSLFNQSFRLNSAGQASSAETNRDPPVSPFQGFPLSPSMQPPAIGSYCQLSQDLCAPLSPSMQPPAIGSYCQLSQDLCAPAQLSSSISDQQLTPFVGLQQSNAAFCLQQTNVLSQQHFNYMSINQKPSSFTDQSSIANLVHKPSLNETNRGTNLTPFQGFPLPASLRQLLSGSYQNISLGTSNYLAPLAATNASHSMASLHQPLSKPLAPLNHPWSSSVPNHETSAFQQPGLVENSKTMLPMLMPNNATSVNHALASSIGTSESSLVFQQHGTLWDNQINVTDSIQKTSQSTPIANNLPLSLTGPGSFSPPTQESSTLAQTEGSVLNAGTHKALLNQDLFMTRRAPEATFVKENIFQAATQQQAAIQQSHEAAVTKENIFQAVAQRQIANPGSCEAVVPKENIFQGAAQQQTSNQGIDEAAVIKETIYPAAAQHFVTSPAASSAFNLLSGSGIEKDQQEATTEGVQELAAIKELPHPAELHLVGSPAGSLPSSQQSLLERGEGHRKTGLQTSDIPSCETLRSTAEALIEQPEFLRNNMTSKKMPAIEVDRSDSHAAKANEKFKEVTNLTLDKTTSLQQETPLTATKCSPFSARSFDSVPGDDDVLATILGRSTSAFKVLPIPRENPVAKRPRVVLRSSFKKRKIEFDTLTVLHGDVIRQQLANTEDIRRVRKKAPCTRREIWSLNREMQGQQLFCEPSLPGLSISLHDLYRAVFGVNGAKLAAVDTSQPSHDLLAVESGNSRLVIEDRSGNSGRSIFEELKRSNFSESPSEAIFTSRKILPEESVGCMLRDNESTAGILKANSSKALQSGDCNALLQQSAEAEAQVGRVQEQISVCEAGLVHNMALDMDAMENVSQSVSKRLEDIDMQGSVFKDREEHMEVVEPKDAVHTGIEKDPVQRLVDSEICDLIGVGKESNTTEMEKHREIEVIASQGNIGVEPQGLVTHFGQELQGPKLNAHGAHVLGSLGTDVPARQAELQSLRPTMVATEDGLCRHVDQESLHVLSNEKQLALNRQIDSQFWQGTSTQQHDFLSRQVNLQALQAMQQHAFSKQIDLQFLLPASNEKQDVLSRHITLQCLQATPNEQQHVLGKQVDSQFLQATSNDHQDVLSRQVNLQSLQATPNEQQHALSRQINAPFLQATSNEQQFVLSKQVNLQASQTTPNEQQHVLSRQIDLQSLQAIPNEQKHVLSRQIDLQFLQAKSNERQDVFSKQGNLHSLQATPVEQQHAFRQIDLQCLQASSNGQQDVLSRHGNEQYSQETPVEQPHALSRQVDLQFLQATSNEEQGVLSRLPNLQSFQATSDQTQDRLGKHMDLQTFQAVPNTLPAAPHEKQDALSREVGLKSLQTESIVTHDVLGRSIDLQATPNVGHREVDLESLQTTAGAKHDDHSMQLLMQSFQATQGAEQDFVSRQGNVQSLQTTPDEEREVVEIQSLSTVGIVVNGNDKERMGDTHGKNLDACKEDQEFAFISDAKVTEFLAADDEMVYDEVGGIADCTRGDLDPTVYDNNGWSARTRNVGRYLKAVFEGMEVNSKRSGEQENPKLGLRRLLMGKTRKEAARMFFETLVLKTREYIHVEQQSAFEDVHLYPSPKLMKTSF